METIGMPNVDDSEIDCYHQYLAQTDYRLERPGDGDHMRIETCGCEQYSNEWRPMRAPPNHRTGSPYYEGQMYRDQRRMELHGLYNLPAGLVSGSHAYSRPPGYGYDRPMPRRVRFETGYGYIRPRWQQQPNRRNHMH